MAFRDCPRCGDRAYEKLKTYSHCVNCLYVEDRWVDPEIETCVALREAFLSEELLRQQAEEKVLLLQSDPELEQEGA